MSKGERQKKFYEMKYQWRVIQGIFYVGGKRYKRKVCTFEQAGLDENGKPQKNTPEAQTWFRDTIEHYYEYVEAQLEKEVKAQIFRPLKIKDLFDKWAKFRLADKNFAEGTLRLDDQMVKKYLKLVGNHPLPIEQEHVDQLKAKLSQSVQPVTLNITLKSLRTFLHWAKARKYIDELPDIKLVKENKRIPAILNDDEIMALRQRIEDLILTSPDPRHRAIYRGHLRFLMICLGTGFRRSEVFYLRWNQIDLERGKITVEAYGRFSSKEKKDKTRDMAEFLWDFLKAERERFPEDDKLFPGYSDPHALTTAFRRHLEALGLNKKRLKSVHWTRAWFGKQLQKNGVDFKTIQDIYGHSSARVTEIYVDPDEERMRQAIQTVKLEKKK